MGEKIFIKFVVIAAKFIIMKIINSHKELVVYQLAFKSSMEIFLLANHWKISYHDAISRIMESTQLIFPIITSPLPPFSPSPLPSLNTLDQKSECSSPGGATKRVSVGARASNSLFLFSLTLSNSHLQVLRSNH
jgi:hypothetical protein